MDATLIQAFEAGKVRSLKVLDQMELKLRKAEERKHQVELSRAQNILDYCAPGGSPQERVVNMMQFYLENPEILKAFLDNFDPFDYHMMVVEIS